MDMNTTIEIVESLVTLRSMSEMNAAANELLTEIINKTGKPIQQLTVAELIDINVQLEQHYNETYPA